MYRPNTTRQKRQSCEACRTRKLKCSGYTGERRSCTRCLSLNITCHYQDKGIPGRPRKLRRESESEAGERDERQKDRQREEARLAAPSPPTTESSTGSIDGSTGDPTEYRQSTTASNRLDDNLFMSAPLTFPLFPSPNEALPSISTAADAGGNDFSFDPFPIELFGQCPLVRHHNHNHDHNHSHHEEETTPPATTANTATSLSPPQSPASLSCHCADDVTTSVRTIRHRAQAVSHAIVGDLRVGADLMERLLTCPTCYDTKKAPRLTIENVLLIGRLMHEVTAGYRRYWKWASGQDRNGNESDKNDKETVSVGGVNFEVDKASVIAVVRQGLQSDAARLTDLGGRFALRQHNRHLVGHETCPDPDGRCWRERYDMDNDPLDICPQNAAARTLTPCYRVVDAICMAIKAFKDDVTVVSV